jgi:hypothetical protein
MKTLNKLKPKYDRLVKEAIEMGVGTVARCINRELDTDRLSVSRLEIGDGGLEGICFSLT